MHLRHLWNLLFNRKKYKKPATITFENVKGFLQGNARALALKSNIEWLKPAQHEIEQSYWRLDEIAKKSPECLSTGQCIRCGCSIEEKVLENRGCENRCYPFMMNYINWEVYKSDYKITIKV